MYPLRQVGAFGQLVVILVIGVAGCSSSPPEPAPATTWGEATVVEELGIGVESGAEEYMFGRIRSMAVAPDGTIYIRETQPTTRADGAEVLLRAYDADGNHLRDIGRVGQGPGEYEFPEPKVLADGRLAVWDMRARRVSLFSPEGNYQGSVAADSGYGVFRIDADDNFYVQTQTVVETRPQILLRKYSIEGQLLDTIPLPTPQATVADPGPTGFMLGPEGNIRPFTVMTLYAWSPLGYLAVGRNHRYDIELQKPEGSLHLRRDLAPVLVLPEERAEWNAFRDVVVRRQAERGMSFEVLPIPTEKPFFRELYAGDDGRIWVFRYVTAVEREDIEPQPGSPDRPLLTWREPFTYDVFEPDGTFLGSVVLPDRFTPMMIRGELLWGVHSDDEGVQRVLRLRVIPEEG